MKKLFIFILASLFCVGLFANPDIPKVKDYISVSDSLSSNDCLVYVNNSGQNIYRLFKEVNKTSTLWFSNESYVTGIKIVFAISFPNEKTMNEFTNNYISSYDLEKEFIDLRDSFIKSEITPLIIEEKPNKIKEIIYTVSY